MVERVDPLLLLYARRHLSAPLDSRFDAADIVNDAWQRILPRLADIKPSDGRLTRALLKYSATVINNRLRDLARAHRDETTPSVSHSSSEEWASSGLDPAASEPGVVSVVARREAMERFHAAIGRLPTRDREIIMLRGIGQQTNEEVGEALGVRPGTVAVRYHRTLNKLRKVLPMSVFDDLIAEDT
jgi:RNA polymerase sigma factor (sigma-70 family)